MNSRLEKSTLKQSFIFICVIVCFLLLFFSLYFDNVKLGNYKGYSTTGEDDVYQFTVIYCKNCHKFNVIVVNREKSTTSWQLAFPDYQNKVGAKIVGTQNAHMLFIIGDMDNHSLLRIYNVDSATLDSQQDLPIRYSVACKIHVFCIVADIVLAVLICVFIFMWFKKVSKRGKIKEGRSEENK